MSVKQQPRRELSIQEQEAIFLEALKPENFALNEEERRAVEDAVRWEKESAETPWILGQPIKR